RVGRAASVAEHQELLPRLERVGDRLRRHDGRPQVGPDALVKFDGRRERVLRPPNGHRGHRGFTFLANSSGVSWSGSCTSGFIKDPRGFAPLTPPHARARAASPARSVRVARSLRSLASLTATNPAPPSRSWRIPPA